MYMYYVYCIHALLSTKAYSYTGGKWAPNSEVHLCIQCVLLFRITADRENFAANLKIILQLRPTMKV